MSALWQMGRKPRVRAGRVARILPALASAVARWRVASVAGVVLALAMTMGVWAAPALAADPGITSAQAKEILLELRKIRQLLENGSAAARAPANQGAGAVPEKVSVAIRDSNALGRNDAPLTMIEYADFQCPFCRRFHADTFEQIRKNFIEAGTLRYVSRDLPLPMHDHAPQAARAARCAGDQQHFWELRHLLIVNQDKLGRDDLLGYAGQLNLDVPMFTTCIDSNRYDAAIQQDAADAAEVGVVGTPTFIIGRTLQQGRFEGIKIVGVQPYSAFEARIREFLAEPSLAARSPVGHGVTHQAVQ